MTVLLTGAAGFIGYHVAEALLAARRAGDRRGQPQPLLRRAAEAGAAGPAVAAGAASRFIAIDVADRAAMEALAAAHPGIDRIVHLAAQAGVRHSLVDPYAYVSREPDRASGGAGGGAAAAGAAAPGLRQHVVGVWRQPGAAVPRRPTGWTRRCRSTPPPSWPTS